MSRFTKFSTRKIDTVFVLALITLFALTAFALVLIGAKQYRAITDTIDINHDERIISSYLAEKIRQNDSKNAITICDLMGTTALSITDSNNDISYTTYIYYYEGALRELVVTDNSVFSLSSGQPIVSIQALKLEEVNSSLLRAEVTDNAGNRQILFFEIHSSIGKEPL